MNAGRRNIWRSLPCALVMAGGSLLIGCARHAPVLSPAANAGTGAATETDAVDEVVQNSIGMRLLPVAAGEFVMGSPAHEEGRDTDEIPHTVHITHPFYLGEYPVTQKEYGVVMGKNPSYFRGEDLPEEARGDLPVESVSWDDAVAFCKKLSAKEGRTYRLPTEAEREYACRAGTAGPFAGNGKIFEIGWVLANSGEHTQVVGLLKPNDWGFYDMQGNVWEWCSDWYGPYAAGEGVDPTGPPTGTTRVLRGGCISYADEYARSAFRNYYVPDAQLYYIGFRVVLETP